MVCCDKISRILGLSPWPHPSIHPCLVSFLYYPYIPSLKSIHLLVSFLFWMYTAYYIYSLRNILPEAIWHLLFLCRVIGIVLCMYANFEILHCYNCEYGPVIGMFIGLPEAMFCCLQTYTIHDVLLAMYCICLYWLSLSLVLIYRKVYKPVMFMVCC